MRVESDKPCDVRMGGWWHNLPGRDARPVARTAKPNPLDSLPSGPISKADADTLNRVYTTMLQAAGLYPAHASYLASCGILDTSGYGSINGNRNQIANALRRTYLPETLRQVPGLYDRGEQFLRIAAPDGLLVAVRDLAGRIIGMQIRVIQPDGGKAYIWLSSAKADGPSPGSPAHFARAPITHRVWITEGAKKAQVVATITGQSCIGMAGHASHNSALALLDQLVALDTDCVVIALDEDENERTREIVDDSRQKLINACLGHGLAVRVAHWDGAKGKGIDDLLLAGHTPKISAVKNPLDESSNGSVKSGICDRLVLILRSALPDDQKIALMAVAVAQEDTPTEMKPYYNGDLARQAGFLTSSGPQRIGRAMLDNEAQGVVIRANARDSLGHSHLSFALALDALPATPADLIESPRAVRKKARDVEYWRCKTCGSLEMFAHCHACGEIQPLNPLDESSSGFDQNPLERASNLITGEDGDLHVATSDLGHADPIGKGFQWPVDADTEWPEPLEVPYLRAWRAESPDLPAELPY